jgi:hypothetical protein
VAVIFPTTRDDAGGAMVAPDIDPINNGRSPSKIGLTAG